MHGCAEELAELIETSGFDGARDRLWLTGDAFGRGPDPLRVWHLLREHDAGMVLGNHDDRLLRHLRARAAGEAIDLKRSHQRTLDAVAPVADELLAWLETVPLSVEGDGFLLVHAGVHPVDGLAGTRRDQFLTIRTWPPVEGSLEGPRWHDVVDPTLLAGRALVFGHDAVGGLVVRRRAEGERPWLVGLDSGCVYGGALSAWWLEEDRLVQVASRQPRRW